MEGLSRRPECTTARGERAKGGSKGGAVQRLAIVSLALCVPYVTAFVGPARQQCASPSVLGGQSLGSQGMGLGRQAALTRRRSVMPEAPPSEKRVRGSKSAE